MKTFWGNPYSGKLQVDAGKYLAFAIGPESDFDQVTVNGRIVSAGRVTFLKTEDVVVEYVRGPKKATAGSALDCAPQAQLVAFECGDHVFNPGPRHTKRYTVRLINVAQNAGNMTNAQYVLVPFGGRRHALVRITSLVAASQLAIYGRNWYGYDGVRFATGSGTGIGDTPALVSVDNGPLVAQVGTFASPKAIALATTGQGPFANTYIGEGWHVGGTDSAEFYDELLIAVSCADASAPTVILDIEVAGEIGVG